MIAVIRRVIESLRLWPLPVLHSVRPISPLPSFDTAVNSWKLAGVRLHTSRITVRLQFDRFFDHVIDWKLRQQPCRENTHGSCILPGSARSDVTSSIFRQRVRRDEEIVAWQPIDLDRLLYRSWSCSGRLIVAAGCRVEGWMGLRCVEEETRETGKLLLAAHACNSCTTMKLWWILNFWCIIVISPLFLSICSKLSNWENELALGLPGQVERPVLKFSLILYVYCCFFCSSNFM